MLDRLVRDQQGLRMPYAKVSLHLQGRAHWGSEEEVADNDQALMLAPIRIPGGLSWRAADRQ